MTNLTINHFLAKAGVGSRRYCENLVNENCVKINNSLAKNGDRVNDTDKVYINNQEIKIVQKNIYLAFNKPKFVLSAISDEFGRKHLGEYVNKFKKENNLENFNIFPIGRLDYESSGLIIFTNDGEFSKFLLDPKSEIEKVYEVVVDRELSNSDMRKLSESVNFDLQLRSGNFVTYTAKPAKIFRISDKLYEVRIYEGKKRQVREMFKALGYRVEELRRVQIASIKLEDLSEGCFRYISPDL